MYNSSSQEAMRAQVCVCGGVCLYEFVYVWGVAEGEEI